MNERITAAFADVPVCASVVGTAKVGDFANSASRVGILAAVPVGQLAKIVPVLTGLEKVLFVNIDSCPGLATDRGGVDFLQEIGATGVVSTRVAPIERARTLSMLTMHKVFVTDRSNLNRSLEAVKRSRPDLVELMPAPIIPWMSAQAREVMSPFVAAGFVTDRSGVAHSLAMGALGAASSDSGLWSLTRSQLSAGEK
ncbi:glycerol-3-phosphate responsive antiterminator GlpP [Amycolatopsis sp. WAC 01375]|uniref:Glycerol uptake operon antiterminator n=1 Tax=Amycolatopsis roodepoortensis TaxID=700274 RepID=A0ABR9L570_9PSEU|nr:MULTISPECIES: glycerol-3-phosphate responsive antiterminator [Amycolatopsis]MBE1575707.1 glycerol uptake operon antiterminator [Amycolatopsis roodepoortensis]RSM78769.1 glycerol-3-phosphate responsive antiterminator GlpP [Amycolatopsis sp. WAC 01375]RSN33093.1 glycerol-3-phosphate responsive antiterminator GlpP [Amycolatopsis sp. WAC 01416]UUV29634.1 glycerol-3-phosphate responsive antiterminator [Amycolatopsis roodepoortensis]